MSKKLFTKVASISLAAAMVVSMAPVNAAAAKTAKPKSMKTIKASKIKVGQTKSIVSSRKNKKSNKDVKYVNFKPANTKNVGIGVKSSDDTVVSVEKVNNNKYTYTGVKSGTATLTVTSRAKGASGDKLTADIEITVLNSFKATQTGAYTFTMSTGDKLEKVDKKDVKVVMEGSPEGVHNAVKDVKLSEDKMSVEVTMEIPFVDGKKYEVSFGKETDSFVASVGKPAAINVKTQTVVANEPKEVEFVLLDEKGMDITAMYPDALKKGTVTVEKTSGNTAFYNSADNKLTMWKVGDTAELKVVYHTFKFDQKTGQEEVVEAKATITCMDKSSVTVTGLDKWTLAKKVLSWDTDEMNSTLAKGDSLNLFVRMKRSDDKPIDNTKDNKGFTFAAVDSSVVFVETSGRVTALKEGVSHVKVTYMDGTVKYEYTLPVTVTAERKATTMTLSKGYVALAAPGGKDKVEVKVMDQYGKEVSLSSASIKVEKLSGDDVINAVTASDFKDGVLTLKSNGAEKTGVYKVTVGIGSVSLSNTLTIAGQKVSNLPFSYEMGVDKKELDISITEDTTTTALTELEKGVTFNFDKMQGGLWAADANATVAGASIAKRKLFVNNELVEGGDLFKFTNQGLKFTPVVKDGAKDYVVRVKPMTYDVKVVVEDLDIGGGKTGTFTMTSSVVVKGSVKAPELDKSFTMKEVKQTDTYANVAALANYLVGTKLEKVTPSRNLSSAKDYFVLIGEKKDGNISNNLTNADEFNLQSENPFIIKSVALPAFNLGTTDTVVWVVEDNYNKELKIKKEAMAIKTVTVANARQVTLEFNKPLPTDLTDYKNKDNYNVAVKGAVSGRDYSYVGNVTSATEAGGGRIVLALDTDLATNKNVIVTVSTKGALTASSKAVEKAFGTAAIAPVAGDFTETAVVNAGNKVEITLTGKTVKIPREISGIAVGDLSASIAKSETAVDKLIFTITGGDINTLGGDQTGNTPFDVEVQATDDKIGGTVTLKLKYTHSGTSWSLIAGN